MDEAFPITIYHNPACGTSRNVLALIRSAGYAPKVVEYLKAGWTRVSLEALLARMGVDPSGALRAKGLAETLGLGPGSPEDVLLQAMIEHPVLVERPIVVSPLGARVCRPWRTALALLASRPASFTAENGETIVF
jgi:arsenate reductase